MYEIVYVDDCTADLRLATAAHHDAGVEAPLRVFASGGAFLSYLDGLPPDDATTRHVLLDLEMPGQTGLAVLEQLKTRPARSRMTIWMFSNSRWTDNREPLKRAGALKFFTKPADYELVVDLFRELGRRLAPELVEQERARSRLRRVLLIEDHVAYARLIQESLKGVLPDLEVVVVTSIAAALDALGASTFDGVIMDLYLPDSQETEGLTAIISARPYLPVVAISGHYDYRHGREAVRLGAQDFVAKSEMEGRSLVLAMEFAIERQRVLNQLRLELSQTRNDAMTDPLTGLANRRALIEAYERLPVSSDPGRSPSNAIVVVDIDGLKSVNDAFGHQVGDALIQSVAEALKQQMNPGEVLARVGGDEFVALLIDLPAGDWLELRVEKMRSAVHALGPLKDSEIRPRASFGHALIPAAGAVYDTIFSVADARMYGDKATRR